MKHQPLPGHIILNSFKNFLWHQSTPYMLRQRNCMKPAARRPSPLNKITPTQKRGATSSGIPRTTVSELAHVCVTRALQVARKNLACRNRTAGRPLPSLSWSPVGAVPIIRTPVRTSLGSASAGRWRTPFSLHFANFRLQEARFFAPRHRSFDPKGAEFVPKADCFAYALPIKIPAARTSAPPNTI